MSNLHLIGSRESAYLVTKGEPTSVILRNYGVGSHTGNTYNADLGNGADGSQATAIRSPHFFLPLSASIP
jgi:hypothetical protein